MVVVHLGKWLIQWHAFEHGQTQDLQHFIEVCREVEPLFDDGDEHVDRDRNPDLRLDGGCTEEHFTGSFADYLLPTATEFPNVKAISLEAVRSTLERRVTASATGCPR